MNAFAVSTPFPDTEVRELKVDDVEQPEGLVVMPAGARSESLIQRSPLSGYEEKMRRHAAACEAGR